MVERTQVITADITIIESAQSADQLTKLVGEDSMKEVLRADDVKIKSIKSFEMEK